MGVLSIGGELVDTREFALNAADTAVDTPVLGHDTPGTIGAEDLAAKTGMMREQALNVLIAADARRAIRLGH